MPLPAVLNRVSARQTLAVVGFLATTSMYMSKLDLSIAIVAMVGNNNNNNANSNNRDSSYSYCREDSNVSDFLYGNRSDESLEGMATPVGEFDWNPRERGEILGSYYYGNAMSQILAGWLAAKFGFKRVVGYSMLLCSFLSLLTPMAATAGFWYMMMLRCLFGFLQGFIFTPVHGAWSVWAPPNEYSKLAAYPMSGSSIGVVVIFPLGGVLAGTLGWRWVFYVTGGVNLAVTLAWWLLVFDRPDHHPWIAERERNLILSSQKESGGRRAVGKTPWREIATSGPVWGVIISHVASNWGLYQMQTLMPTYLHDVLGMDLFSNGFLTGLPYVLQAFTIFFCGYLTDTLISRGRVRTLTMRKWNNAVSLLVPAACLLLAGYAGCHVPAVIAAFVAAAAFNSFVYGGSQCSLFDFAPRYAPIIYGISNTFAQMAGFAAPQTTGLLLQRDNSHANWVVAFAVSALVHLPGFVAFQFLGSDEVQPWALGNDNLEEGEEGEGKAATLKPVETDVTLLEDNGDALIT